MKKSKLTIKDALRRWPRLVAHMVCESLGELEIEEAAVVLLTHRRGSQPINSFFVRIQSFSPGAGLEDVRECFIESTIKRRHSHESPLLSYAAVRETVFDSIGRSR